MTRLLPVLAVLIAIPAWADGIDHHHPPQDIPLHEQFYSTWMRPDQPMQSCCNRRDCAPADGVRLVGGKWQARSSRGGDWITIPEQRIERRRDSPDGRAHLCVIGLSVICFIHGTGM